MIYVIRLIKRLSARNVRAYTGRANLRAGTGNGLCGSTTVAREGRTQEHGVVQTARSFFFSSFVLRVPQHGGGTRRAFVRDR